MDKYSVSELINILVDSHEQELRRSAWEYLKNKSPTPNNIRYILRWVFDDDIKNQAGIFLRTMLGLPIVFDEHKQLREIAEQVLKNTETFQTVEWHIGDSHCIAGWLCVLNQDAAKIEAQYNTGVAGAAFLPSFVPYFYTSKDEAIKFLKQYEHGNIK